MPATILVVDHDPEFRRSLRSVLEAQGFRVIEAGGSLAAQDALKHGGADLMITTVLTDFAGAELMVWARRTYAAMPIILVADSGYPVGVHEGVALLLDPVPSGEFVSAIRRLLRPRDSAGGPAV